MGKPSTKYIGIIVLLMVILCLVVFIEIRGRNFAIIGMCLCVIFIYVNGRINKTDANAQCLIGKEKKYQGLLGGGCFDVWHVQHVLFWIIIGILWPGHIGTAFMLSVGWELLEHIFFKYRIHACRDFFCGRYEDILANMIGYLIGMKLI